VYRNGQGGNPGEGFVHFVLVVLFVYDASYVSIGTLSNSAMLEHTSTHVPGVSVRGETWKSRIQTSAVLSVVFSCPVPVFNSLDCSNPISASDMAMSSWGECSAGMERGVALHNEVLEFDLLVSGSGVRRFESDRAAGIKGVSLSVGMDVRPMPGSNIIIYVEHC